MVDELERWLNGVSGSGWQWFVKYLAGNDTLLTKSHQAGPYVPRPIAFGLFPTIADTSRLNPRASFHAIIDSHGVSADPNIIWYNNATVSGTRNECRITGWGGSRSPVMDPESTGSLCIFAFRSLPGQDAEHCRVWLCHSVDEEDLALGRIGPVEPGSGVLYHASGTSLSTERIERDSPCRVDPSEVPAEWLRAFPEAIDIVDFAIRRVPSARKLAPDARLIRRRQCEFDVFRSVEEILVLPGIRKGFENIDSFVDFANTVTNRRKSRSGASLELHAKRVFDEEHVGYSHGARSEGNKRPDFIFPSAESYHDPRFPPNKLRILAVKTTCKDRWRQILNEANRVKRKHLLTLQEGISCNQLAEMRDEGVTLVVPSSLHSRYPQEYRSSLFSFDQFIREVKR
jgi:hypothetical protein